MSSRIKIRKVTAEGNVWRVNLSGFADLSDTRDGRMKDRWSCLKYKCVDELAAFQRFQKRIDERYPDDEA